MAMIINVIIFIVGIVALIFTYIKFPLAFNALLFIFGIATLIFIFLKLKKMSGVTSDPKQKKEEGDDKKDESLNQANTNLIKVTIFRPLSDGLVAQAGQPIMCQEKPDDNNNQIVINEERRFKEDFNFQKDRIFEVLEFQNRLQNHSKKKKAELLDTAIKDQEELVNEISSDVNKNKEHNIQDEKLKLRQLKVLRSSLQMETTGNYMRLGVGGVRQYEFVSVDGILYPYFFGGKWYRVYPDLLIKKKIFNQENTIFKNEIKGLQAGLLSWILIVGYVIMLIGWVIGGSMIYYGFTKTHDITTIANQGAVSCTNTLAKINENYGTIINDYQNLKKKEIETNINNQIPNNNIIGNIVADPSQITR